MKPELRQLLLERYPELYDTLPPPGDKYYHKVEFGNEDGWFPIIDVLSECLSNSDDRICAVAVGEAFGILQYVIVPIESTAAIGAVTAAQLYSQRLCEFLGRPADLMMNNDGKLKTLSPGYVSSLARNGIPPMWSLIPEVNQRLGDYGIPDAIHRSAWTPQQAAERLKVRHGILEECEVSLPAGLFDLADCCLTAVANVTGYRRLDYANRYDQGIKSVTWTENFGLEIKIERSAILRAAVRRIDLIPRGKLFNHIEPSKILIQDQIFNDLKEVIAFSNKMSLRLDPDTGHVANFLP